MYGNAGRDFKVTQFFMSYQGHKAEDGYVQPCLKSTWHVEEKKRHGVSYFRMSFLISKSSNSKIVV